MQLMQKTAYQYNVSDRFDPRENIYAGVQHLSHLMNRFNGKLPLVLAAYNAGSSAVEAYDGIPPYPETRRYVIKVMNFHNQYLQTSFDRTSY
jgi:soluble lytic murein transglycosylase-like protein